MQQALAEDPDDTLTLLVAMSIPMTILKFPWRSNGLGSAHVWHQFTDGCSPDGMLWHDDRLTVTFVMSGLIPVKDAPVTRAGVKAHFDRVTLAGSR